MNWPPNFAKEDDRRAIIRRILASTDDPRKAADDLYADDPVAFVNRLNDLLQEMTK